jgi:RNA polymerase sigma-70 factor, ECF subfamily
VADRHAGDNDDPALVRRCLADEEEAWRALVDRHRPGMIELARRILPAGQAEEVVDGVIADLWRRRKLAAYEGRSSLRTWLGAVVMNAALNARRSAASRPESPAEPDQPEPIASSSPAADERQFAAILHDAITSLSPSQKTLVLMYYEQGLTLDEIAAVLGGSKSTSSRRLREAREDIVAAAKRLAEARGTTLASLRDGVDLGQLDVDLRRACAAERHRRAGRVSNS